MQRFIIFAIATGADPGGGCRGCATLPHPPWDDLRFSNTTGILRKKTMWFIGVEVEQETSAPPPKKDPGSAPVLFRFLIFIPSIIPIRTFVFVNFVLCSLFFFSKFSEYIFKCVRTLSIKKPNVYTSHGHEMTRNLHAPFTWKAEVHFVTSNTKWLNKVHLSKDVVFTEGKEKVTIYEKRWSIFWSICHRNSYHFLFWKFLLFS